MPLWFALAGWAGFGLRGLRLALLALVVGGLFGALTACAYHMGAGERHIPGGYRAVAVPVFKNVTHEVGAEVYFTNSFILEMQRSGIGVLSSKENSQVTVEGTIERIGYTGGGPSLGAGFLPGGNGLPNGVMLNGTVSIGVLVTLRLRRNSDQKVLWEGSFTKELAYRTPQMGYEPLSGANALYNQSAKMQNLETLAQDMMSEAHDRLTENF